MTQYLIRSFEKWAFDSDKIVKKLDPLSDAVSDCTALYRDLEDLAYAVVNWGDAEDEEDNLADDVQRQKETLSEMISIIDDCQFALGLDEQIKMSLDNTLRQVEVRAGDKDLLNVIHRVESLIINFIYDSINRPIYEIINIPDEAVWDYDSLQELISAVEKDNL